MQLRYLVVLFVFFASCSKQLLPGKYVHDRAYFLIDNNGGYEFHTILRSPADQYAFSKGIYHVKNNVVTFQEDSSMYFSIKADSSYFDSTIGDSYRIFLRGDKTEIDLFDFWFINGETKGSFDANGRAIFTSQYKGAIKLSAAIKDNIVLSPNPITRKVYSNSIYPDEIYAGSSQWNCLILHVNINSLVFSFTNVAPYNIKKGNLVKKYWPVFRKERPVFKREQL